MTRIGLAGVRHVHPIHRAARAAARLALLRGQPVGGLGPLLALLELRLEALDLLEDVAEELALAHLGAASCCASMSSRSKSARCIAL